MFGNLGTFNFITIRRKYLHKRVIFLVNFTKNNTPLQVSLTYLGLNRISAMERF